MNQFLWILVFYSFITMFDSDCARNKNIFPIQFSISETKVVDEIPEKDRDFAFIIPGDLRTYIYNDEAEYYKGYQRSYFAITTKKGGWDCMRHYEILANGCIPYFVDIDKCNPNTMYLLPRHLIREAMNLEGVSYLKIDHSKFNKAKYYEILDKLLEYTRKHLTAKNMAAYLLETVNYSGTGKILFLTTTSNVDYLINSTLIGLKELLGDRVVDIPKVEPIYKSYSGDPKSLYGKGFSYSKIVDDIPVDRNNIKQRIENKEFDLIIYGYLHYELPFHDLVTKTYKPENIVYMCGQDEHRCPFAHLNNLFLREFDSI